MSVKELVIEKRKQLNLSINEVSKAVGVTPSTLSRFEKGKTKNISMDIIAKLQDVLSISNEELMGAMSKRIENMDIVKEDFWDTCNVCSSKIDVKTLKMGQNNQLQVTILCRKCRKKLINILIESL